MKAFTSSGSQDVALSNCHCFKICPNYTLLPNLTPSNSFLTNSKSSSNSSSSTYRILSDNKGLGPFPDVNLSASVTLADMLTCLYFCATLLLH